MNDVPAIHRVPAHLARRFHQVCLGALAEVTGPASLSPLQYGIIASVADEPGLDQKRLAERIGIDVVSAHHHLEYLTESGLVERVVDANDRRSRKVHLTPAGTQLRNGLRLAIQAAHQQVMSALTAEESKTLLDLLTRVVESNRSYAKPGNGRKRPARRISELMK